MRKRLGRSWRSGVRHEHQPAAAGSQALHPPLVVSCHEKNTQRIAALDEQAEALSLRRGMGIAEARAMHPAIEIIEADPHADQRLLEALADWCDRYTPLVAFDGNDGLFLDISGCAHLFGGEKALLDDILLRLFDLGFDARSGIASTPGAAWAAARFLNPALIAPAAQADALLPLPLSALRLEPAIRLGLESVGLRTIGAVMKAPRAPLARRFGKVLLLRLDQALGHVEEAVSPRLPVAPLSVERHLAEPVVTVEAVEELVFALARSLEMDLERRGEGARRLQLALFRVDGEVRRYQVGTSRPVRAPAFIVKLFHERLAAVSDELDAGYGFELIRLSVLEAVHFDIEQTDLSSDAAASDDSLALLADRVSARLGNNVLVRPVAFESHVPERAVALSAFYEISPRIDPPVPAPSCRERPLRLLVRPEPIDVSASEVPEGPPLHFRWRRMVHRITSAEGPERIAPEWWRQPDDTPVRDYFRVEDADGRRYWVYRQGLYGGGKLPRWFMQGIFA